MELQRDFEHWSCGEKPGEGAGSQNIHFIRPENLLSHVNIHRCIYRFTAFHLPYLPTLLSWLNLQAGGSSHIVRR